MILNIVLAVALWCLAACLLAPVVGAAIAGRRMSRHEVDALSWGALGLFCGLFLLAFLLIGTP